MALGETLKSFKLLSCANSRVAETVTICYENFYSGINNLIPICADCAEN